MGAKILENPLFSVHKIEVYPPSIKMRFNLLSSTEPLQKLYHGLTSAISFTLINKGYSAMTRIRPTEMLTTMQGSEICVTCYLVLRNTKNLSVIQIY